MALALLSYGRIAAARATPLAVAGTACADAGDCDSGFCDDGVCCQSDCGDDSGDCQACNVSGAEGTCTTLALGSACRPAADLCDVAERCDGVSTACPADALVSAGTVCRALAGDCDVVDRCDGQSSACPDAVFAADTLCRAADGACDAPEHCDGNAPSCPDDALAPAGTVCRESAGGCDVVERCDGQLASCPVDGVAVAGAICRASASQCDAPEACNGSSPVCAADIFAVDGTDCDEGSCVAGECKTAAQLTEEPNELLGGGCSCSLDDHGQDRGALALSVLLALACFARRRRRRRWAAPLLLWLGIAALLSLGGCRDAGQSEPSPARPTVGVQRAALGVLVWSEVTKLKVAGGAAADALGTSVAVDGTTAIVGAPNDDTAGAGAGAAYVFVYQSGSWSQQAVLTASDAAAADRFGRAVAIDGDTVVIGADGDESQRGAAYVFVRGGSGWSEQAKLTASDGTSDDHFGQAVALDGDAAIVGAPRVEQAAALAGAAYIFARAGTSWSQETKLSATGGGVDPRFGAAVALAGDTAAVGSPQRSATGAGSGAVFVFFRSAVVWSQQAVLTPAALAAGDELGAAVALASGALLAGAPGADDSGGAQSGAAVVFTRAGAAWNESATLTAADGVAGGRFGAAVALEGNTALVGAEGASKVYGFSRAAGSWGQDQVIGKPGTGSGVALAGRWALLGAPSDDEVATDAGAAFVFASAAVNGIGCSTGDACQSGHCVDGVCCEDACAGGAADDCRVCNAVGKLGRCVVAPSSTICRPAIGSCDLPETCDGQGPSCPLDLVKAQDTPCGSAVTGKRCDLDDVCDGVSPSCPDLVKAADVVCRVSVDRCDAPERCDGTAAECPADLLVPKGSVCRNAVGACDLPELCDGATVACPLDRVASSATICRLATNDCDRVERCDGVSGGCPDDAMREDGDPCSGGTCRSGECRALPDAGAANAYAPGELDPADCSVAGGDPGWLGLLALLALCRRRRGRRARARGRSRVAALLAATVVGIASVPSAAEVPGRLSVVRFRPTAGELGLFVTEGATTLQHLSPAVAFSINYARRQLIFSRGANVITSHLGLELMAALGLWDRIELGFGFPVIPVQRGDDLGTDVKGGRGDLRLQIKGHLASAGPFSAALSVPVVVPTGDRDNFLGDEGVSVTPTAVFGLELGRVELALNLGYRIRSERTRLAVTATQALLIDDELAISGGVKVRAIDELLDVIVDWQLAVGVNDHDNEEIWSEAWGGLRFHLPRGLSIDVGGGPGLSEGAGTPEARLFAGLRWQLTEPPDSDGDGYPDRTDRCPQAAEDFDGFKDDDGCPEADNDGDGVPDIADKCPTWAEDKDGYQDDDGCPEADNDADGVDDASDKCPDQAEDKDGFEDEDGCPDPDNDGDGVADDKDACPNEKETANGYEDDDGCPDEVQATIERFSGTIKGITFDSNKAVIRESSRAVLDEAVAVLKQHPQLKLLIRGHTDNVGRAPRNVALSLARAHAVKAYLEQQGIAAERLSSEGVGPAEPVGSNDTAEGRAENRRIEFKMSR